MMNLPQIAYGWFICLQLNLYNIVLDTRTFYWSFKKSTNTIMIREDDFNPSFNLRQWNNLSNM